MKYCTRCGNKMTDDVNFCQVCGTKCDSGLVNSTYSGLNEVDRKTSTPKKNSNSQISPAVAMILTVFLIAGLLIIFANVFHSTNTNGDKSQPSKVTIKKGEDYEGDVWQIFWEWASESIGVEYSDYDIWNTSYDYIQDFTTLDGYTSYYYLIRTAYNTKNLFGQKVSHPVTARAYCVPECSTSLYITYVTIDGKTVLYDEEKESWLMGMGSGGATVVAEESTGILWENFLLAYNEISAEDPEGNGYLIDDNYDSNSFEYNLPNGETLFVELTNDKYIVRIEFVYPSTDTSNQTIIMHRWWAVSSIVYAFQNWLNGGDWNNIVITKADKILAELAVAGGSDDAKERYQSGMVLTSSDLDHGMIYTRYVDTKTSMSHLIVYGYGKD